MIFWFVKQNVVKQNVAPSGTSDKTGNVLPGLAIVKHIWGPNLKTKTAKDNSLKIENKEQKDVVLEAITPANPPWKWVKIYTNMYITMTTRKWEFDKSTRAVKA